MDAIPESARDPRGAPPATGLLAHVRARALEAGALLVTIGLALVGTRHPDVGGFFVLTGWVALAAAVHAFGRAGT